MHTTDPLLQVVKNDNNKKQTFHCAVNRLLFATWWRYSLHGLTMSWILTNSNTPNKTTSHQFDHQVTACVINIFSTDNFFPLTSQTNCPFSFMGHKPSKVKDRYLPPSPHLPLPLQQAYAKSRGLSTTALRVCSGVQFYSQVLQTSFPTGLIWDFHTLTTVSILDTGLKNVTSTAWVQLSQRAPLVKFKYTCWCLWQEFDCTTSARSKGPAVPRSTLGKTTAQQRLTEKGQLHPQAPVSNSSTTSTYRQGFDCTHKCL